MKAYWVKSGSSPAGFECKGAETIDRQTGAPIESTSTYV